ncbi:IS66 family insertion sequence element accessory protein TnpA [Pyxidicoccus caerfyrddinensis]|uniref:IS66 family insertion sequence element accessory protein TnpA n=1 Tax=Pyxidicoccus caerfyrddinensis TaxID=2709663 RepID=UPI003B831CD2
MANAELWKKRVENWRTSGLSADEYCEGQEFTTGPLYRSSSRLAGAPHTPWMPLRLIAISLLRHSYSGGQASVHSWRPSAPSSTPALPLHQALPFESVAAPTPGPHKWGQERGARLQRRGAESSIG